ncbi:MAG: UDP-glucose/iron transport system ATP-binding protein [Frankiales bacterium]|nr:UDP-glucose/iron transport system ATP-binding protein [Frankiales bacterium]
MVSRCPGVGAYAGDDERMTAPLFRLDGVTVRRGEVLPLRELSLSLSPGVATVLVGPSGAGKSTLLRLLNRLEEPTEGSVSLHGQPLPSYDVLALRRRVGMLQQAPVILEPTVLADLRVGRPSLTVEEAAALLERVGLAPELFLDRSTEGLSGGEAQRVCLARALAVGPEVMLLDEPTSALDSFAVATVEAAIRGLLSDGLSVVMVSHDLRQARRLADEVVVLIDGRVAAAGPSDEVLDSHGSEDVRRFLAGAL